MEVGRRAMARETVLLGGWLDVGLPSWGKVETYLLGTSCQVTGLPDRLLGLALLARGATHVALHGGIVFEEVLCLPPMERVGGLEHLHEVF